jgi:hypothetical protein
MPSAKTSATWPCTIDAPDPPRPDTANTRSPSFTAPRSALTFTFGRFGRSTMSSARSRSGCHVQTVALRSSPPLRTNTPGPGERVAARTAAYEVTRKLWSPSDATTNAVPADACPASSCVCTNHTESFTPSISRFSVSSEAASCLSGPIASWISFLALSVSASMMSFDLSSTCFVWPASAVTFFSFWSSLYW